MSDFWIVSSHRFCEQPSFESAEQELIRLQTKLPKKRFRMYRCKRNMQRSGTFPEVLEALKSMMPIAEWAQGETSPPDFDRPILERAYAAIAKADRAKIIEFPATADAGGLK